MAKSIKNRTPNEAEIDFIKNHFKTLSVADIASKMPDVNTKEIDVLVSALKNSDSRVTSEAQNVNTEDQFIAGNLMAKREGITIMTPQASELADARRTLRINNDPNFAKQNSDKIHVIRRK